MTREEQIEEYIKIHAHKFSVRNGYTTAEELMRQMAQWCDNNPKSPWISVNDRMPEEGQQILEAYTLECTASGIKSINEEILFSCYRGKFVCNGKETNYGIGKSKSTTHHWMPIPQIETNCK